MNRTKQIIKYVISLALAALLLGVSFREVEWKDFIAGLKDCRWGASAGDPVQINLFRNRLEQIRADQEKLVELMIRDGMDQGILTLMNEKAERLAEEKRDLTERLRELEERESIGGGVLAERWKSISLEERRAVCRLLIHRIRIWKDGTAEVIWNL